MFSCVIFAVLVAGLWREHQAIIAATGARTENISRVLEEHARQSLRRVDAVLARARDDIGVLGALEQVGSNMLRARLLQLLPEDGFVRGLAVVDRHGQAVATTGHTGVAIAGGSERDYFVDQRAGTARTLAIGIPIRDAGDGRWMLPASYRLTHAGGGFGGIVVAFVEPDYWQRFYDSIDTGRSGGVALFLRNGWIVARSPFNAALLNRSWIDTPMFREHLPKADVGTVRQIIVADGVERIYTYRALKDFPVIVYLGLSLSESLAGWRDDVWQAALQMLLILCAVFAATWFLLRQLRLREGALAALRESEERFRGLTQLSSDWFWEQDENYRFTYFSAGLQLGSTVDPQRSLGKTRWELPEFADNDVDWAAHRAALDARQPFHGLELTAPAEDGGRMYVRINGEPVFGSNGQFRGYRGTGQDVTDSRRAAARINERSVALDRAVRELESLCYTLAHDMRAPLRAVTSFSGLLIDDHGTGMPEEARADLHRIERAARTMALQLDELLEFARLSRIPVSTQAVDMGVLVRAACLDAATRFPVHAVELVVDNQLPACDGDPVLLKVAVTHLIVNAYKFTLGCENARVHVGVKARAAGSARHTFFVGDNGVGFDMRHAGHLFEMFQRLHTAQGDDGRGVGLAFAKRIIELHGGGIEVFAEPGKGAIFYFDLSPAGPAAHADVAVAPPDSDRHHPNSYANSR